MLPIEEWLIKSEIKSLLIRERFYRDSCQWDELRGCYHPDTTQTSINISWFTGDVDGFVNGSRTMASNGTASAHTIQPVEIHINGNKAVSISTGSVHIRITLDEIEFDMISWVIFVSRLSQVEESGRLEWRLKTLEAIYDRDSIATTKPTIDLKTVIEPSPTARASYKYLDWVLSQRGYSIAKDLPGTDIKESMKSVMDESYMWLKS